MNRPMQTLLLFLLSGVCNAAMLPEPDGDYVHKFDRANARTISEVYCSVDVVKLDTALNWRDTGISVRTAQSQLFDWRAEEYIDLRIYYQRLVTDIYAHPAVAYRYIHSGRAYDDCVVRRRGF